MGLSEKRSAEELSEGCTSDSMRDDAARGVGDDAAWGVGADAARGVGDAVDGGRLVAAGGELSNWRGSQELVGAAGLVHGT